MTVRLLAVRLPVLLRLPGLRLTRVAVRRLRALRRLPGGRRSLRLPGGRRSLRLPGGGRGLRRPAWWRRRLRWLAGGRRCLRIAVRGLALRRLLRVSVGRVLRRTEPTLRRLVRRLGRL
ncbi:hypothetical protein [Streptomyces sp. NPDC051776]|uniref:hypothetical protein n=1 Tax=Streptomyces sp. NPDC051776 TaxID=3155414 RepID=UPI003434580A